MGFSQPVLANYESQAFPAPAYAADCNPQPQSDFYPRAAILGVPEAESNSFLSRALQRPSAYHPLGDFETQEGSYRSPADHQRFRQPRYPASQPLHPALLGTRNRVGQSGLTTRSNFDCAPAAEDFSLAAEDSPPFVGSQLPYHQRPFPIVGEPSTMLGSLPHEAGSLRASLPTHCRWSDFPLLRSSSPGSKNFGSSSMRTLMGDYGCRRNFTPTLKREMTGTSPRRRGGFSFDTTVSASPHRLWKPATDDDHSTFSPGRRADWARHFQGASQPPAKKKFKSRPTSSALEWDSDDDISPVRQSDPAQNRCQQGHVSLSPIAKSTPCPLVSHDRRSIRPSDKTSPSSPPRTHRHVHSRGIQTAKSFATDAAVQTDMCTNIPIYREVGCPLTPPPPLTRCQDCGCHRETVPERVSPAEAAADNERPTCRSVSSLDNESPTFLNDLLIGFLREE